MSAFNWKIIFELLNTYEIRSFVFLKKTFFLLFTIKLSYRVIILKKEI